MVGWPPGADASRTEALARPFAALVVLLLLLTGQRLREVAGVRWEEVDFAAGHWVVPGARTKNKLPHLVPLSRQARAILVSMVAASRGRGWC